jgi:broad specificity phosphatase PhoE
MDQIRPSSNKTTTLYLCRHAETQLNHEGKLQGRRMDPPLNATGLDQAHFLGSELAACGARVVASSTLKRAQQTAAAIAEQLPSHPSVLAMPELDEIDFGSVADGMPMEAAHARVENVWRAWASGDLTARPDGGGESLLEVLTRFSRGIQKLLDKGGKGGVVVAVTHSGLLDVIISAAMAHIARGGNADDWWTRAPETWNLLAARFLREDNACINELVLSKPSLSTLTSVPRVAYRQFWVWDHGAGADKSSS